METQQLQMILDTIKSVAGTAGTAGVVWICVHYFVQLITAIAEPIAWCFGFVMTARYASTFFTGRAQVVNADLVEQTKQRQIELEKAKVEATKHEATVQLRKIAKEAGVSFSEYSGIYLSSEFNKIIEKVKA